MRIPILSRRGGTRTLTAPGEIYTATGFLRCLGYCGVVLYKQICRLKNLPWAEKRKGRLMKAGILDSGIGGISVLNEAYHSLDDVDFIFYADTDHVPYGLKTGEEIREYSEKIVEFFLDKEVDAVLMACNTATAVAAKYLRGKYDIPIIGMEPAVKPAVTGNHDGKRILVMATPVTVRENKLHDLLEAVDKDHQVDLLAMPGLVSFAEKEIFDGDMVRQYLTESFCELNIDDYSAVVLGCTHFNYFKPLYREFFNSNTIFIDGNTGTVKQLAKVMGAAFHKYDKNVREDRTEYYFSGRQAGEEELEKLARLHLRLEEVRDI